MMPDVDVRALTDTALWEGITRCARSQDMWARQMAAANNGERGPPTGMRWRNGSRPGGVSGGDGRV